ncbi:MAG: FAD/NAD(P)-binding protein, partial [Bdellovibrio sp.]
MAKDLQTLVVGGGFAGLFVARALAQSGHQVCLIEPETDLGGSLRGYAREGNKFDSCLQVWPDPDSSAPAWRWAQESIQLQIPNLHWTRREERPRTYAHSQWIEFAGFGDSPPDYVEDLAPWLVPTWGECDTLLSSIVQGLAQNPTQGPQVEFLKAWVTSLEVSDGQCRGLWINSTKKIEASRVYWCAPIEALRRCLPSSFSPERSRMKAASWVGLDWHCSDCSFGSS